MQSLVNGCLVTASRVLGACPKHVYHVDVQHDRNPGLPGLPYDRASFGLREIKFLSHGHSTRRQHTTRVHTDPYSSLTIFTMPTTPSPASPIASTPVQCAVASAGPCAIHPACPAACRKAVLGWSRREQE